ncbi:MAG: hypothetical protein LBL18_03195 [Bacteroidales bacterium]|nr:hypothetical protein [Bacteroidales bacterium]
MLIKQIILNISGEATDWILYIQSVDWASNHAVNCSIEEQKTLGEH